MGRRIRHCLECPQCRTRYLVGSSPYRNGSYLVSHIEHAVYKLYCSCGKPPFSRNGSELRPYAVSNCAHDRGYGSPQEIVEISNNSESVDGRSLDEIV